MRMVVILSLALSCLAVCSLSAQGGGLPVAPDYLSRLVEQGAVEHFQPVQADSLLPNPAELERGWLLYHRDRNYTVFPNSRPAPGERLDTLRLTVTPGAIESQPFCAYGLRNVEGLAAGGKVEAEGPGGWLVSALKVEDVLFHPVQYPLPEPPKWPTLSYVRYPTFIRPVTAHALPQGESRLYWVTVSVPEGTPSGVYRATLRLVDSGGHGAECPLAVRVLPFRLTEDHLPRFGSFLSGEPFAPGEWRLMKRYGLDALQWFWGSHPIRIQNAGGKLTLDFTQYDAFVKGMQQAGMRGPLVLSLGNSWLAHYEMDLAREFSLPLTERELGGKICTLADFADPRWEKIWVEGLRQIFAHAKAAGWPELALLIHDEPTKHLLPYYIHKYYLVKKNFPEVPVYGVFFQPEKDPVPLVQACDIVVANRDLARMSALARIHGKRFWSYINVCADQSFGVNRLLYGQIPAYYGSEVMFFWCWNYWVGDPWNDFDGWSENAGGPSQSDADWVAVYPAPPGETEPVRTLALEAAREAIDDVRYLRTLEQLLDRKAPERKQSVLAEVRRRQAAMFDGIDQDMRVYRDSDFFRTTRNEDVEHLRDWVTEEILQLTK